MEGLDQLSCLDDFHSDDDERRQSEHRSGLQDKSSLKQPLFRAVEYVE